MAREGGEAASIRQMVKTAVEEHTLDRTRIFISGLSAGGAMTAVMLATYPDIFAAGAVIAGLTYGAARSPSEAWTAMFWAVIAHNNEWGDKVRAVTPNKGQWPSISVGMATTIARCAQEPKTTWSTNG